MNYCSLFFLHLYFLFSYDDTTDNLSLVNKLFGKLKVICRQYVSRTDFFSNGFKSSYPTNL